MTRTSVLAALLCATAAAQTAPAAPAAPTTPPAAATPAQTPAQTFVEVPLRSAQPVRTFTQMAWVIDPARTYRAVLSTTQGDITVELASQLAPRAVNNFVFLALNRYYDGTRFHRVIDGFMAQGGDPLSADPAQQARWGTGGPGYGFYVELDPALTFKSAGVLAMARAQSLYSQGSQFFLTLAPADFLSGQYTVFGRVVAGQDVLAKLTRTARSGPAGETPIPGAVPDTVTAVRVLVSP